MYRVDILVSCFNILDLTKSVPPPQLWLGTPIHAVLYYADGGGTMSTVDPPR